MEGGLGSYLLPGGTNNDYGQGGDGKSNHTNSLSQLQDDADMVSA